MHQTDLAAVRPPQRGASLNLRRPIIVAVDGPAGSGKSSICFHVAARLGWTYVNTGALYRAVGLLAARNGLTAPEAIADLIEEMAKDLSWDAATRSLSYRGRDLTPELASEEAGQGASRVAKIALVRDRLLPVQRQLTLAANKGALVDGRDIGTVVFPDADLKIFLTASIEARSLRRVHQLGLAEDDALGKIKAGIAKRDEQDKNRDLAPLKLADDAVTVDTSDLTLDQTVDAIVALINAKGLAKGE